MMYQEIYTMKLHDFLTMAKAEIRILRVPGGWIYESFNRTDGGEYQSSTVFVPYNNEFEGGNDGQYI